MAKLKILLGSALLISFSFFGGGGCSHSIKIPVSRFVSPEVKGRYGDVSIGGALVGVNEIQISPDVTRIPPFLDNPTIANKNRVRLLADFGIARKWDLFVRAPFASINRFGIKYQLLGDPYIKAQAGNFSMALAASFGMARGSKSRKDLFNNDESTVKFSNWMYDGSIILGYRFSREALAYLDLFATRIHTHGSINQALASFRYEQEGDQRGAAFGLSYHLSQLIEFIAEGSVAKIEWPMAPSETNYHGGFAVNIHWDFDESGSSKTNEDTDEAKIENEASQGLN